MTTTSKLDPTTTGTTTTSPTGEPLPEVAELVLKFSEVKQFDFSWSASPGAKYYQLLERADDGKSYVQVGNDIMGSSVSLTMPLHLRPHASYILRACNGGGCTDSEPVSVAASLAMAVGYFKASNTGASDKFRGAALSADGNTLVVGSTYEDSAATGVDGDQSDNSAPDAGAVYVFVRTGTSWSQQAYIKASNTGAGDFFGGGGLALSADGNTLAVGAYGEDSAATGINGDQVSDGAEDAGAVYIFVRTDKIWSQQAYVKASNTDGGDNFGDLLALSADGNTLLATAVFEGSAATGIGGDQADNTAQQAGAVYIFVRTNKDWSQQAYIKASNAGAGDHFALTSLSADGNTLAVGAFREDGDATGIGGFQDSDASIDSGAVYVFVRANGAWSQQAYIKASNAGTGDLFGYSVALSGDGNTLAVGAQLEDSAATGIGGDQANNTAVDSGAVYVFFRNSNTWSQQAYIKASNTETDDRFGYNIALSADGNVLAVGAIREDGAADGVNGDQTSNAADDAGAVYIFVYSDDAWAQQAYVKAPNPEAYDAFGSPVALSPDGSTLIVAAGGEDGAAIGIGGDKANNSAGNAGAIYVY